VGSGFLNFPSGTDAHAAGLPTESDVNGTLFGDPNVTAAYNSPEGKTPLALVALSMASLNQAPALAASFSARASFSFEVSSLQSGRLLVGLLDTVSSGPEFTSLHFSITREGTIVEDQTFATMAAANTYFNDHALNLGPLKSGVTGALDLNFLLEMTTLDNGARYGISFLVANAGIVAGLPGDFNGDGKVDAADYVVWQKNGGTQADYDLWRANFGRMAGSGAASAASASRTPPQGWSSSAVPEPSSAVLIIAGLLSICLATRRRTHGHTD
jgi:hypothetical protein